MKTRKPASPLPDGEAALIAVRSARGAEPRLGRRWNYITNTQTGQSIIPGTTDIGNHCDDCTTRCHASLPGAGVLATPYTSAFVELERQPPVPHVERRRLLGACMPLPINGFDRAFIPYQGDLRTDEARRRHLHRGPRAARRTASS